MLYSLTDLEIPLVLADGEWDFGSWLSILI
jgi:hypothetical protein